MKQLGWLEEWLDATARKAVPAVSFTSLFPFQGDTLFAPPPSNLWPPPASLLTTPSAVFLSKIRWTAAKFVPLSLIESILMGQKILADQWIPDPETACLLRRDRPSTSPFHVVVKSRAAVDRVNRSTVNAHSSACVEFEAGAGLWTLARYPDEAARGEWDARVNAAFRLLGDAGFGGGRSSGWGQTETPEFQAGTWPGLLLPRLARMIARRADAGSNGQEPSLYWLLSLFSPSSNDAVQWRDGDYEIAVRGGHIESAAGNGHQKKRVRMVTEGSVLAAGSDLVGTAVDVAPDGFPHAVYRAGFAVALKLPVWEVAIEEQQIEAPFTAEAAEPIPGEEQESEKPAEDMAAAVADEVTPEPVIVEPATEEPPIVEPVVEEPVIAEPLVAKPVIGKPVIMEPPVSEEPPTEAPAIMEPVIEEPLTVEPPIMELPIEEPPTIMEPVIPKPPVPEPLPTSLPITEGYTEPPPDDSEPEEQDFTEPRYEEEKEEEEGPGHEL
jgi:CRISPR type III-A-associated RAMP protein Csm4